MLINSIVLVPAGPVDNACLSAGDNGIPRRHLGIGAPGKDPTAAAVLLQATDRLNQCARAWRTRTASREYPDCGERARRIGQFRSAGWKSVLLKDVRHRVELLGVRHFGASDFGHRVADFVEQPFDRLHFPLHHERRTDERGALASAEIFVMTFTAVGRDDRAAALGLRGRVHTCPDWRRGILRDQAREKTEGECGQHCRPSKSHISKDTVQGGLCGTGGRARRGQTLVFVFRNECSKKPHCLRKTKTEGLTPSGGPQRRAPAEISAEISAGTLRSVRRRRE